MSAGTLLAGFVIAILAAALVSEVGFAPALTNRGRIVVPLGLALVTWVLWAGMGAIVGAVLR